MAEDKQNNKIGRRYLGEILVDAGLITHSILDNALKISKAEGKKVGNVLIDLGIINDVEVAEALADQLTLHFVRLADIEIEPEVLLIVSRELVNNYIIIPIKGNDKKLTIATANPLDMNALDDVRFATGLSIDLVVTPEQDIVAAIDQYYPGPSIISNNVMGENDDITFSSGSKKSNDDEKKVEDLVDLSDMPPIVRFVNAIITDAINQNASDIHIEPHRYNVVVRYRVDGVMREIMKTDRSVHLGVVTRIKVVSKLDISARRIPQDGKLQITYKAVSYDLRVSTLPTSYGEKITIRVLSSIGGPETIEELEMSEKPLAVLRESIMKPQGIVLVTGPTGSGKTTTLYACLKTRMSPDVNIVTLENPIEYDVEGINQVEVNPKTGLTFAEGLRSILRQDPDIVLLGEIRDEETASIAFHAAQTGHLVFSTLHTNSAVLSIARLVDLGIDHFTIGTSVNAVVAQRLVRRLCDNCKELDIIGDDLFQRLPDSLKSSDKLQFWKSSGCDNCGTSGYSGRVGIHEVLQITPHVEKCITANSSVAEIERQALGGGFSTLSTDGMLKAAAGLTSLSEVYRVAPPPIKEFVEEPEELINIEGSLSVEDKLTGTDSTPVSVKGIAAKKILVAEDEEFMLRLIQGILEGEGYKIITAKDGEEALMLAMREAPDLIITDFQMPKMNGITLINELKSKLITAYIPVVMLTGTDEIDLEVEGINMGAHDFLTKPINARKLIARVNRLIINQGH
jgi:type IV pilus assembly protein PilB